MLILTLSQFLPTENITVDGEIIAYCDLYNTKVSGFFTAVSTNDTKYEVIYYENQGAYLNHMGAAVSSEVKLVPHTF